jgi:hypothetical protein
MTSHSDGRGHIDWEAAFQFYAELGPVRSFGKVSRRFGVSDVAVGLHARKNGWAERVQAIDAKVQKKVDALVVRDRAVRLADTIAVIDQARQEMLGKLRAGDADVKLADLPALIKLEMLIEGEATDRIETKDVQEVIHSVFVIAGQFVPPANRAAFLAAIGELSSHAVGGPPALELIEGGTLPGGDESA